MPLKFEAQPDGTLFLRPRRPVLTLIVSLMAGTLLLSPAVLFVVMLGHQKQTPGLVVGKAFLWSVIALLVGTILFNGAKIIVDRRPMLIVDPKSRTLGLGEQMAKVADGSRLVVERREFSNSSVSNRTTVVWYLTLKPPAGLETEGSRDLLRCGIPWNLRRVRKSLCGILGLPEAFEAGGP